MSTPPEVCSFALGRGLYCALPADGHSHRMMPVHTPASHEGRLVCSCGDFNCASLDAMRCTRCNRVTCGHEEHYQPPALATLTIR